MNQKPGIQDRMIEEKDATPQYNSGQPMPPDTYDAILFTAKTGFISAGIWRRYFGSGNDRSKRRTLRRLCERSYFRRHHSGQAKNVFLLGAESVQWLKSRGYGFVRSAYLAQLDHDLILAESVLRLELKGYCDSWWTEAELKIGSGLAYAVKPATGSQKHPDLLITLSTAGGDQKVAIELELTQKSAQRYQDTVNAYDRMEDLSKVIFVARTDSGMFAIKRAFQTHGSARLRAKVLFAELLDWHVDPGRAPLSGMDGTTSIAEICKNQRLTAA